MKPAKNIKELYNNLNPFFVPEMGKDDNIYVPLFEKKLNELRTQILIGNYEKENYYVCGQTGSGKSSALNFIKDDKLKSKYEVVYIKGRELFDSSDIDIIDILLMFALEISGRLKNNDLVKNKIQLIYDKHERDTQTETISENSEKTNTGFSSVLAAGVRFLKFFNASAEFKSSYQRDKEYRKITREFFNFNKSDLLQLANEVIDAYYEEFGSKRKILAIFDDLEKIRDIQQINAVFIDNRYYLCEINCKKIFSVSVHLATQPLFSETNKYFFVSKIYENPLSKVQDNDLIVKNKGLFRDVIRKRMSGNVNLISDDAIELAIKNSGGIIRQYFQILYRATLHAITNDGNTVSIDDVETACQEQKNAILLQITGQNLFALLDYVGRNHHNFDVQDEELFITALLSTQVIFYQNFQIWYDVNPLIKEVIPSYTNANS